jgi:hypothetical protein
MGDRLETELAEMTRWEGDEPGLWELALQAEAQGYSGDRSAGSSMRSIWNRPLRTPAMIGVLSAAACVVLVVSVMLPSLGRARSAAHVPAESSDVWGESPHPARLAPDVSSQLRSGGPTPSHDLPNRQVVRKVTVELAVDDVSAAYMKALRLVSEAHGEFIEESSLSGAGRGTLTLRVSVERLSGVLDELRALGTVTDEKSSGEDVTDQVVDLEARISNEQLVEKELLELLESRADAPLEDLLRLREEVNRVRVSIERMTAQRERLSRLVSLASVLVIIRAEDEPVEEPEQASLWGGFAGSLGDSWTGGVRVLGETVAGIVRVLVGAALGDRGCGAASAQVDAGAGAVVTLWRWVRRGSSRIRGSRSRVRG